MPSIRGNPARGPDSLVTPTNAAGLANSNEAPTVVTTPVARQGLDGHRADIQVQILLTLRAISRQLAEGFGLNDDLDTLITDEDQTIGVDGTV
jgi:hypothetical protein